MNSIRYVFPAAACALALAACSSPNSTATPRGTAEPSPSVVAAAASSAPSPSGPKLHSFGEKVPTRDNISTSTVYAFRQPSSPKSQPPSAEGTEWGSIDVEVCVSPTYTNGDIAVSWRPWVLVYADNTTAQPSNSTDNFFPQPEYPSADYPMQAGRCVRGWITFVAQKGKRPTMVEYRPQNAVVDWAVT